MKNFLLFTFAAAVITSPWPIGGNYPFARTFLLIAAAILLIGWIAILWGENRETSQVHETGHVAFGLPLVSWVLFLGVLFTFFQSSSISERFQTRVETAQAASDSPENSDDLNEGFAQRTISVYPPATRRRLVDLLLATGFFVAAVGLLRDRRSITWMLMAISAVGICLSGFGIVQKLSFNGKIYGVYELLYGGDPFGPFVNGNNASGFLLVTFAAILFFVANQLFSWGRRNRQEVKSGQTMLKSPDWIGESSPQKSIFAGLIEIVSIIEPKHLYFLSLIAVIVAGICVTLSRSGMVAMLVMSLFVFSLIARTNWKSSLALALLIMLAGTALVVYLDRSTEVTNEIESLSDIAAASEMRLLQWNDALPFAMENYLWGVGNGTYRYVSPSFQSFFYPRVFVHAESIYVETFVEMGIVGLILIAVTLLLLAHSSILLIKRDSDFDRSLGIVGLGALAGQATIAIMDFGLYQAPNSIVMATLMGIVAGRAARPPEFRSVRQPPSSIPNSSLGKFSLPLQFGVGAVMCACMVWAVYESYGIESQRLAARKITYFDRMNRRSDATGLINLEVSKIESLLGRARDIRPDDADVLIQLGELKVAQVRTAIVQETQDAVKQQKMELAKTISQLEAADAKNNADVDSDSLSQSKAILESLEGIKPNEIWATGAPIALHQKLRHAQRRSGISVAEVFGDEMIAGLLADAYQDYKAANEVCPWLTLPPLRLAQLSAFKRDSANRSKTTGMEEEQHYISVALDRSFTDTQLLYNCGFLALNSGDQALAVELWSKCLSNPHYNVHERAIVSLCIQEMPMNLFFEQVLPQNPHDLIRIASKYFRPPELMLPKRILLTHTKDLINSIDDLSSLERNLLLADAAVLEEDFAAAVTFYQSALRSDPPAAPWRLKYAQSLFKVEDYDEALRQLKICQLDSGMRQNQVNSLLAKIRRIR